MKCVTSLSATLVDREENGIADMANTEMSHAATLRVQRTAEWAADDHVDHERPEFTEFAEHALPDGTLIEGFRIVRSIGEGGFGIVYLAWDVALERHVAIKEYMPTSLAIRANPSLEVSMRSDRHRGTFDAGLKSFVNEARLLARFDHPALVKVFRFWEANRTAYMAMPFYEGPTLKATLATAGNTASESELRAWLEPLLDALSVLHREHCYHRDISPDNILLTTSGPVLLDFGAARRVISDMTQVLTAVLKPGFAPIEQYGGELQQGPWTDLYALAGVVHYAITGRAPTASVVRVVSDTLRPLAVTHAGKYSDNFLRAVDLALSVRPEARPQDIAEFRALLDAGKVAKVAAISDAPQQADAPKAEDTPEAAQLSIDESAADPTPSSQPDVPQSAVKRSHRRVYLAATACLLLVGSATFWTMHSSGSRQPDLSTSAAAVARSPAPVTQSPVAPTVVKAVSAIAVTEAPAPAPAPAQAVATPVTAIPDTATPIALTATPRSAVRMAAPSVPERKKPATVIASVDEPRTASRTEFEAEPASLRKAPVRPQRCAEIIQKSSLDTLTADEVAYLKKECR